MRWRILGVACLLGSMLTGSRVHAQTTVAPAFVTGSCHFKPAPGFSVGGGEPGKALKTERGQEVKGGLVGLVIDARGRPIELPATVDMEINPKNLLKIEAA